MGNVKSFFQRNSTTHNTGNTNKHTITHKPNQPTPTGEQQPVDEHTDTMSAAVAVAVVGGGGGGGGAAAITESKGSPVEEKTEDGHTEVARKKVGYADRMVGEWCANPAFAGVTDLRKGNHYYNSDGS